MTSSFLSNLNESTNSYLTHVNAEGAAAGVAPVGLGDLDLGGYMAWAIEHLPVEVAPVKGAPKDPASATGQVWAYLDSLVAGKVAFTRKGACDALVGAGLNAATVATQYQRWTKTRGYSVPAPVVALPTVVTPKAEVAQVPAPEVK